MQHFSARGIDSLGDKKSSDNKLMVLKEETNFGMAVQKRLGFSHRIVYGAAALDCAFQKQELF